MIRRDLCWVARSRRFFSLSRSPPVLPAKASATAEASPASSMTGTKSPWQSPANRIIFLLNPPFIVEVKYRTIKSLGRKHILKKHFGALCNRFASSRVFASHNGDTRPRPRPPATSFPSSGPWLFPVQRPCSSVPPLLLSGPRLPCVLHHDQVLQS